MKTRTLLILSVGFALIAGSAQPDDEALRNDKPRVAQVVTLARLVPKLCEGIFADDEAIQVLMGKAGITDDDTLASGAFEAEDTAVTRSFVQSVGADHDGACSEIFDALGPHEGGLLRRTEIKPIT